MRLPLSVTPGASHEALVEYRWDPDTDILTAQVATGGGGAGMTGSIELEGSDGSWLIIDVRGGRIAGVEVAVWPDVRKVAALAAPADVEDAAVAVPSRPSQPGVASVEVDTAVIAEADADERTIHFRLGAGRSARTIRVAGGLLFDLDDSDHVTGIWMCNVPPFPAAP